MSSPGIPTTPSRDVDLADRVEALAAQVLVLQTELTRLRMSVRGAGPRFAELYPAFQERFRGPVDQVRDKLAVYLPDARQVSRGGTLLDLGSGRGEWLALLRDSGLTGTGVDSHPERVASARARGLDVVLGDAVGNLHGRPPGSVDLVTAFHLVEHLDVEEVLELLDAARAALRPGGLLLLETPSATNLTTGACDFYCDPTHLRPLPPTVAEWLVTATGFVDVEVRHLHPKVSPLTPVEDGQSGPPTVQQVVEAALFGPQDYSVLARRAG